MLPLVLEEVHLLLPLFVVYRSTLALPLLDHLHLKVRMCTDGSPGRYQVYNWTRRLRIGDLKRTFPRNPE